MSKRNGFTLIEILVAVSIVAVLTAIAIPGILDARMSANEASAKATLITIGKSVQLYYFANSVYPNSEAEMMLPVSNPPYLNKAYCSQTVGGYSYSCQFGANYTLTATPQICSTTGRETYIFQNGNIVSESNCQ